MPFSLTLSQILSQILAIFGQRIILSEKRCSFIDSYNCSSRFKNQHSVKCVGDLKLILTLIFSSPEHKLGVSYCHHPMSVVRRHPLFVVNTGWSGGAKVLCILHHRGVQLILAYSWARPAILVVGKGRGGMFLFLLFLHFHSCSSFFPVPLFHLLYSLFYLFSPFLWETTQNDPQGLTCR